MSPNVGLINFLPGYEYPFRDPLCDALLGAMTDPERQLKNHMHGFVWPKRLTYPLRRRAKRAAFCDVATCNSR